MSKFYSDMAQIYQTNELCWLFHKSLLLEGPIIGNILISSHFMGKFWVTNVSHLFRHFESNLPTNCPHGRTGGFVDDLIPFNGPKRIKFSIHHLLLVEIWQKYGYFCINEFCLLKICPKWTLRWFKFFYHENKSSECPFQLLKSIH